MGRTELCDISLMAPFSRAPFVSAYPFLSNPQLLQLGVLCHDRNTRSDPGRIRLQHVLDVLKNRLAGLSDEAFLRIVSSPIVDDHIDFVSAALSSLATRISRLPLASCVALLPSMARWLSCDSNAAKSVCNRILFASDSSASDVSSVAWYLSLMSDFSPEMWSHAWRRLASFDQSAFEAPDLVRLHQIFLLNGHRVPSELSPLSRCARDVFFSRPSVQDLDPRTLQQACEAVSDVLPMKASVRCQESGYLLDLACQKTHIAAVLLDWRRTALDSNIIEILLENLRLCGWHPVCVDIVAWRNWKRRLRASIRLSLEEVKPKK
jgi:hypothetical protein